MKRSDIAKWPSRGAVRGAIRGFASIVENLGNKEVGENLRARAEQVDLFWE